VKVNGRSVKFSQQGDTVCAKATFFGQKFTQCQQIGKYDSNFTGGVVKGSFIIPQRIFDQLAARKKAWPVNYTKDDLIAPWLGSDRLLLLVSIADAKPSMKVEVKINGEPVEVKKAFNGIYPNSGDQTFIGNYIDISDLANDTKYNIEVTTPTLEPGQFLGLYFDNIETEYTRTLVR
jgi:hypothetical protein